MAVRRTSRVEGSGIGIVCGSLRLNVKAEAGTKLVLALPERNSTGAMCAWMDISPAPSALAPCVTGNEDMTCPVTGFFAAIDRGGIASAPDASLAATLVYESRVSKFVWRGRREVRPTYTGTARHRAVCRGWPRCMSSLRRKIPPIHSTSHLLRVAAVRRPGLAPASGHRVLFGGAVMPPVAPQRVSHVQQNANRCISPRRNKGGRPSR